MSIQSSVSRREILKTGGAALGGTFLVRPPLTAAAPVAPVAVERCRSYGREFELALNRAVDQIGGAGDLVRGKTVAIKPNLTGDARSFPPREDLPFRTHPESVLAVAALFARLGAHRIRIIEGFFPVTQEMAGWAAYGFDISAINNCSCRVEWENTNHLGKGPGYKRHTVPWGGYLFPAYDLNHSYMDCDVFVSMSMLKNHWLAGFTAGLKNNFGITPPSLYGGDAGPNGNEAPSRYRGEVFHNGSQNPASGAPRELDPDSPRDPGYRIPRAVADLAGARPIDFSIIDGVSTIRGGEGAWNPGVQWVRPGVLIVGRNAVCTDAVAMAVMGYDPRAGKGTAPFLARSGYGGADNALLLAEAAGIGSADLAQIEVTGLSVEQALFDFGPGPLGQSIDAPGAQLAAFSAARVSGLLAPGSIVSVYGRRIASQARTAPVRFLTELDGVRVDVTGSDGATRPAEMLFASPAQANIVIPDWTAPGPAKFTLYTEEGAQLRSAETIRNVAPGVFAADGSGRGVAAAYVVRQDSEQNRHQDLVFGCALTGRGVTCDPVPVSLGEEGDVAVLSLFLTGIRRLAPGGAVRAWVGGEPAEVWYAGPQPEYSGLDQVNLHLKRSLAGRGIVEIRLEVDGEPANPVTIRIA